MPAVFIFVFGRTSLHETRERLIERRDPVHNYTRARGRNQVVLDKWGSVIEIEHSDHESLSLSVIL